MGGTSVRTTRILAALLLCVVSAAAWADDHGNSPLSASPVLPDGSLLTACIENAGDMDYFLFEAVAGRTYRIETSHPSEDMDSILYLIDRDGESILAVDDDSAGETSARIVWTCPRAGVYFLMVRHAQATSGTGCYGVSVGLVQLDDHGNDRLTASPIAVGVTISGFLEESGDTDVFVLNLTSGYEYTIEFSAQPEGGPLAVTAVANGSSEPVVVITSAGAAHTGVVPSSVPETLFLFVAADSPGGAGSYALTVERGGYADDHGNSAAAATPIALQWTEIVGDLEVAGDVDWFRLDAQEDTEYAFELTSPADVAGLRLAVRGPDGQVLQESATAVAGSSIELDWMAPETSVYYLEVSSTNASGSYVLGITATLQMQAVGGFNPSGYSLDVATSGTVAYLVVGTKGLLVVNISDPTDPIEIGSHSTNGYAQAVAVDDRIAYVANRSEGVAIIDVSDPSRPVQIGTFDTPGSAHAVTLYQGLALISDQRGGLQIARIQSDGTLILLSAVDTLGYPAAVAASGDIVWVAVGDAGIEAVDLSEPSDPVSLGSLDVPGDVTDIVLHDELAYVAAGYRGVRIVDVSNPVSPREVGWLSSAGEAVSVLQSGNTLFVAEQTEGVSAYSLLNPLEPQLVARIDTPGEATSLAVAGNYIYVADRQEGLLVVQLLP